MFMSFSPSTTIHGPQDPVVQFWTWFQLNEKKLQDFRAYPSERLGEIHQQLQRISKGLIIEADLNSTGARKIVFSADGNEDLFFAVQDIVKKAPRLAGWEFIAFRQRLAAKEALNLKIEADNISLKLKEMMFFPVLESDTLDVIIYTKNLTAGNYAHIATYSFQLLDQLLGEYDAAKKVRAYDFHPLPGNKKELAELRPLIELPIYIDSIFNNARK